MLKTRILRLTYRIQDSCASCRASGTECRCSRPVAPRPSFRANTLRDLTACLKHTLPYGTLPDRDGCIAHKHSGRPLFGSHAVERLAADTERLANVASVERTGLALLLRHLELARPQLPQRDSTGTGTLRQGSREPPHCKCVCRRQHQGGS